MHSPYSRDGIAAVDECRLMNFVASRFRATRVPNVERMSSMAKRITRLLTPKRALGLMLLAVSAPSILAGCESESLEQIRQADQQRCTIHGTLPGSAQFGDCMEREHYQVGQAAGPSWGPPFGSGDW